jgi:hypothetical protein
LITRRCKAPLSCKNAVECKTVVVGEAQPDTELLAAGLQGATGDMVIVRHANEIRELAGLLQDRAQHCRYVWRAIAA